MITIKGGIFQYIVDCTDQGIFENMGAMFRQSCLPGQKNSGLIIQMYLGQQISIVYCDWKAGNIVDFAKDDPAVDMVDTWEYHDDRVTELYNPSHFEINLFNYLVGNGLNNLNG